ncbi:TIGR00270 family protein [Candidatus Marsarchaeota G2 archaeon ECH_B_SAG-F08]|uniref:TIGR00270 family protein n=6 Tax=Candidatus Marsarchaeota TaxID=1978152 RepID=A0A2R6AGZ1_9ARCH|nr:MAG: TIGR00270 family protein [Candidatus Marsarchaeota G1 archaeon OSP_D]PSN85647.1 MAG: TIGR00270 family protein [Candidatus Marsarchaeota G1 archaeon BE_D]PSN89153.1 MAG: TIGR00270 family protein [Candidatus Marsarchaeota G1 archaeon OSP_C]PSN91281.1 MAG: TIGR00270 family protein [Candidatus Marsarchaeota G1 archaeon OSP_B]PSN97661.1 MAG: TIGR00270 family protein [Candidatus Marsarchaeota G2 archaeon ECH_B_SAG-F08]PSO04808.1 MAG: TIGR00270 family protein [Candidatus Marsarchaeota G2 arch
MPYYCELCGKAVNQPLRPINYFGEKLLVCESCNSATKSKLQTNAKIKPNPKPMKAIAKNEIVYDIVENYAKVIKEAREKLKLTIQEVASKTGLKESFLRRIESAKLVPDIETAKRLERLLKVNLLIQQEKEHNIKLDSTPKSLELRHVAKLRDDKSE